MNLLQRITKLKFYKTIFGYDLFISYSRKDSLDYAYAIAQHFMNKKKPYECYIDQLASTKPGKKISKNILNAIQRSQGFILIGSEAAQNSTDSDPILQEIDIFLQHNKNNFLIPININSSINVDNVRNNSPNVTSIEKKIFGLTLVDETLENFKNENPSEDVLNKIEAALKFTKKRVKLRNIAITIFLSVILFTVLAFVYFLYIIDDFENTKVKLEADAAKAKQEAEIQIQKTNQAKNDSKVADSLAAIAIQEKNDAETFSQAAKLKARESQRLAHSNFLAMNASIINSYDPTLSYNLAKIAFQTAPENVYTYNPIFRSIMSAPFYKDRLYLKSMGDFDFSPDNKTIAFIGENNIMMLYSISTGNQTIIEITNQTGNYSSPSIQYSPNGQYIMTQSPGLKIWDNAGKIISSIDDNSIHPREDESFPNIKLDSSFFDITGQFIVTASTINYSFDSTVTIWKTWNLDGSLRNSTPENFALYKPNRNIHENFKLSTKENIILLSEMNKTQDFIEDYTPIFLRGHFGNYIKKMEFSSDGNLIGSLGDDNYFILWNNKLSFDIKISNFTDIKVDNKTLSTISYNENWVKLYNIATGEEHYFSNHLGIKNVGFLNGLPYLIKRNEFLLFSNGQWNSFAFIDKSFKVEESINKSLSLLVGEQSVAILHPDINSLTYLTSGTNLSEVNISNDEKLISIKFNEDSATVYDLTGMSIFKTYDNIESINFTPESQHIIVNRSYGVKVEKGINGEIIFHAANKENISVFTLQGQKIWSYNDTLPLSIQFNGNWQFAMTNNIYGENIYWDINNNKQLFTRKTGMQSIISQFTRDKRYFLTMAPLDLEKGFTDIFANLFIVLLGGKSEISLVPQLWDVQLKQFFEFKGKDIEIANAKFSPNEKFIITYDFDKNITIWDIKTKKPLELTGHYKKIEQVDFSANEKWILTYSEDRTIRIWDYQGNEIYSFDNLNEIPNVVGFIGKGDYIYLKKLGTSAWQRHAVDNDTDINSEQEVLDSKVVEDDNRYEDCNLTIKLINPLLMINQIDDKMQLGQVWQINDELKIKYKVNPIY